MKRLLYFLVAASLWTGCSEGYDDSAIKDDINDLKDKVTSLEQQIASLKQEAQKINSDIAAMQSIANGVAITKVTEHADGGYTVTFSNGKSYTIANGQKGDQGPQGPQGPEGPASTPMMRIDAEGYWQVSYDGGTTWEYPNGEKVSALGQTGETGDQGAQGAQGYTPMLSVDADGYWTVSYDGGKSYERLKDAAGNDVKAVVAEGAGNVSYKSVFESVSYSAENSTLQVVLAGTTEVLEIPVGGAALAQLYAGENPVEGVQSFAAGETKSYTVKAPTADLVKVIGTPDGWKAVLKEMTLEVTAPAAEAATRATADSATDLSLLVVMKNGLATVLRMQVTVDGTTPDPTPDPDPDPTPDPNPGTGESKSYSLIATEAIEGGLGLPGGSSSLSATPSVWSWNSIGFESVLALTTSGQADGTKVPVFYLYKVSKSPAETFIRNTTALGEIQKITITLIDNGKKKGNQFLMTETVNGVQQTVLSSNDNESSSEHVYTFTAGNNGMFTFSNPSENDCKVLSFVIEYKQ